MTKSINILIVVDLTKNSFVEILTRKVADLIVGRLHLLMENGKMEKMVVYY